MSRKKGEQLNKRKVIFFLVVAFFSVSIFVHRYIYTHSLTSKIITHTQQKEGQKERGTGGRRKCRRKYVLNILKNRAIMHRVDESW